MTLKVIWKNKQARKALKVIKNSNAISNNKMCYKTVVVEKSTDVRMDKG